MPEPLRLLIGTNNPGKVIEIADLLHGLPLAVLSPKDLQISSDPDEPGDTFAENALIKARHFAELSGLPTIADDSGIHVEALAGELGVRTRRWGAGPTVSDQEWIAYFLKRMENEENRRASFVSVIAYVDADGAEHIFEGRCDGVITSTLENDFLPGLPFDGCFRPDGFNCVYGGLSTEQKNSTSHRGKATLAFREFLLRQSDNALPGNTALE